MRTLTLKKEALTELSPADLSQVVAGGQSDLTLCLDCINDLSFEVCPTLPIEECHVTTR